MGHRDLVRSPRLVDGHLAHDGLIIGVLVSEHGVVGGGVSDRNVLKDLVLQLTVASIASPRELREPRLLEVKPHRAAIHPVAVLDLILVLVEAGHVVHVHHLVTGPPLHPVLAHALSTLLVTVRHSAQLILSPTKVTVTVLTSKQFVGRETKETILTSRRIRRREKMVFSFRYLTLPTLFIPHSCFTGTLTIQLVTDANTADGSIPLTVAGVTANWVRGPEIPEQRLARVTDSPGDGILALTELTLGHAGAASHGKEVLSDTIWVTVTLLTLGVIEPLKEIVYPSF